MRMRKLLKLLTLGASSLGVVSTTAVAGILAANSSPDSELFAAETRHYKGEWYNEGALVYEEYLTRGQNVEYKGPTPSKVDYTGEKIYIFSGWDTTGDGIADLPMIKAYRNFKANATYTSIDASLLEKIDWQKLLEILMDADIDLEALLARLGLSPEDIAKLLGLNVFTVTSSVAGPAYFRTESFKDYNKSGHNWTDSDYYPVSNISPGSVNPLQYTANKVSSLRNNPLFASYCQEGTYEITYQKTGGKYPVIAFETENTQGLSSDSYSLTNINSEKKYVSHGYSVVPCTEETVLAGLVTSYSNDAIKNDEKVYRDYVRSEYLGINDEYKKYFSNLASQIGASNNNVGQAVTAFTEYLTKNFTLEYKRNEFPKSSDPLLYFMNEAKVADSNYFASAMTLFLRSLGYPARYTQGYMGAIGEAGVETPVTALQAYSWCEVYVDGIGWMNADGAEYLLVKLFGEYYDLPEEVLDMMDFSNKGTSRKLESIRIGDNTKFNYVGGTNFSENDIELIATYDDGYEEKVKPCFVTTPDISDYKSYYDCNVTVLYEYLTDIKSVTYTIHVEPAKIEELLVSNDHKYTVVSTISPTDFEFKGIYNNGNTYDIDPYTVSYSLPEIEEEGDYPVDFTFTEYYGSEDDFRTVTTTFVLHIDREPYIVKIEPMYNVSTIFYTDEGFTLNREDWLAIRSNDEVTQITITDEMILNPEILEAEEPGTYTLQIQASDTCEVYNYTFRIVENVLEYIQIFATSSSFLKLEGETYYLKDEDFVCRAYYTRYTDVKTLSLGEYTLSQTEFEEEGTYSIEASYSEEFPYSGLITKTDIIEIKIKVNRVIGLVPICMTMQEATIRVSDEVSEDLFMDYQFDAIREDQEVFHMNYDDEKLSYDFSQVDRFTPGTYDVVVSYTGSDKKGDVTATIPLHVLGIASFTGHFDGIPEELLTGIKYTEDDFNNWGIYATVVYTDGALYEESKDVYIGDPCLTVNLQTPFDEQGSYALELYYYDGYETKSDSTIVTAYNLEPKEVRFDFSNLDKTYFYLDEINLNSVSAVVTYYGGSTNTIRFDSGLISYDKISIGGVPEKVVYTFSLTLNDIVYSDSVTITLVRPVDVYFDNFTLYQSHCLLDPLDLNYYEVLVKYDDNSVKPVTDPSLASLSYVDEPHPGANDILISYFDGYISLEKVQTLTMYDIYLDINVHEHDYFEGDSFTNGYNASLVYDYGEGTQPQIIDVTNYIEHEQSELGGGSNTITFTNNIDLYGDYVFTSDVEIFAYYLVDVEFDATDFNSTFYRGDSYDENLFDGLKIIGHYEDGDGNKLDRELNIYDCTIINFNLDELGSRTFTVLYDTKDSNYSASFFYTVVEPMITDISFNIDNCSLVAYEGVAEGIIDYSNLTYTLTYENGYYETLEYTRTSVNGWSDYRPPYIDNETAAGIYSMPFTYYHDYWDGEEYVNQVLGPVDIDAEVKENNIERLQLDLTYVQRDFYVGKDDSVEFNYTDLKVYAITSAYEDFPELGKIKLNSNEYTVTSSFELGTNIITVSYNDDPTLYTTYEIYVYEDSPSYCYIHGYPSIVKQGDTLDFSEVYIEAVYYSGFEETVYQPDFEIVGDTSTDTVGQHRFSIVYQGIEINSFVIEVIENGDVPISLHVSSPNYVYIEQGQEELFLEAYSQIRLFASYLDHEDVEISIDDCLVYSNVNVNEIGDYFIEFTYTYGSKEVSTYFYVYVTDTLKITRVEILDTLIFTVGSIDYDTFLEDVRVMLYYNDGTSKQTTLSDKELIPFYNVPKPPVTNEATEGSTVLSAEVFIFAIPNDGDGFLVTYKYRVVEAE